MNRSTVINRASMDETNTDAATLKPYMDVRLRQYAAHKQNLKMNFGNEGNFSSESMGSLCRSNTPPFEWDSAMNGMSCDSEMENGGSPLKASYSLPIGIDVYGTTSFQPNGSAKCSQSSKDSAIMEADFPLNISKSFHNNFPGIKQLSFLSLYQESRKKGLRKTSICRYWSKGACAKLDCNFAHGERELNSTPDVWKTTLCKHWKAGCCSSGDTCRHAHGEQELRQKICSKPPPNFLGEHDYEELMRRPEYGIRNASSNSFIPSLATSLAQSNHFSIPALSRKGNKEVELGESSLRTEYSPLELLETSDTLSPHAKHTHQNFDYGAFSNGRQSPPNYLAKDKPTFPFENRNSIGISSEDKIRRWTEIHPHAGMPYGQVGGNGLLAADLNAKEDVSYQNEGANETLISILNKLTLQSLNDSLKPVTDKERQFSGKMVDKEAPGFLRRIPDLRSISSQPIRDHLFYYGDGSRMNDSQSDNRKPDSHTILELLQGPWNDAIALQKQDYYPILPLSIHSLDAGKRNEAPLHQSVLEQLCETYSPEAYGVKDFSAVFNKCSVEPACAVLPFNPP